MGKIKRCAMCYGFTKNELKKLKLYVAGIQEISSDMKTIKIKDIIDNEDGICSEEEQKVILFNEYPKSEIKASIKKIRQSVPEVILAVVTDVSKEWTFGYLLEHLIKEKEFEQKGGK